MVWKILDKMLFCKNHSSFESLGVCFPKESGRGGEEDRKCYVKALPCAQLCAVSFDPHSYLVV